MPSVKKIINQIKYIKFTNQFLIIWDWENVSARHEKYLAEKYQKQTKKNE